MWPTSASRRASPASCRPPLEGRPAAAVLTQPRRGRERCRRPVPGGPGRPFRRRSGSATPADSPHYVLRVTSDDRVRRPGRSGRRARADRHVHPHQARRPAAGQAAHRPRRRERGPAGNLSQNARVCETSTPSPPVRRPCSWPPTSPFSGIHVDDVGLVAPPTRLPSTRRAVHCSGRTARAGAVGTVVTGGDPGPGRRGARPAPALPA